MATRKEVERALRSPGKATPPPRYYQGRPPFAEILRHGACSPTPSFEKAPDHLPYSPTVDDQRALCEEVKVKLLFRAAEEAERKKRLVDAQASLSLDHECAQTGHVNTNISVAAFAEPETQVVPQVSVSTSSSVGALEIENHLYHVSSWVEEQTACTSSTALECDVEMIDDVTVPAPENRPPIPPPSVASTSKLGNFMGRPLKKKNGVPDAKK